MNHSAEKDVKRIWQRDLAGLNANGSACEACGRHMHEHEWADLDPHGLVVTCVFSPAETVEGVGTGAGEGAPRQDTGSAWVTRSADCPEAPAQAHPRDPTHPNPG